MSSPGEARRVASARTGEARRLSARTGEARRLSARAGSNAEAEDSAARIAELVRRTAERGDRPGPAFAARPAATMAQQPPMPAPPIAQPAVRPVGRAGAPPDAPQAGRSVRRPSRRIMVGAGAVAFVLIAGTLAISHPFGSDATSLRTAAPASPGVRSSAPAGYAIKVTDVITDCAGHAHGRTMTLFSSLNCVKATRSLATGTVNGRPVLFVESRIQMASAEAAASVKQVLDGSGTGNLNDLLREGKTFPGAPDRMPTSGYASVQTATVVSVAEAGFVDQGPSASFDPALRAVAAQVAALVSTQN